MKTTAVLAIAMLGAACPAMAFAQETLPPIRAVRFVSDCAHPSLPTQRQVGEWAGLQNFGQVYAARENLMAEIGRACQRPNVARAEVVIDTKEGRERDGRALAIDLDGP